MRARWPKSLLSEGYARHEDLAVRRFRRRIGRPHDHRCPTCKAGLEPFRKVRDAVGGRIEIMCELHSLWTSHAAVAHLPRARGVRRLLGRGSDRQDERRQGAGRPAPRERARRSAAARRWAGRAVSRTCWPRDAVDVVMLDLAWCGGLTEGAQDRSARRGLRAPAGAARLHRSGHLDGRAAPRAACADCHLPGSRARDAQHLVPRTRDRPARDPRRNGRWHRKASACSPARASPTVVRDRAEPLTRVSGKPTSEIDANKWRSYGELNRRGAVAALAVRHVRPRPPQAQMAPETVTVVVPFPPEGSTDTLARVLASHCRLHSVRRSSSTIARAPPAPSAPARSSVRRPTATRCSCRSLGAVRHLAAPGQESVPYDPRKDLDLLTVAVQAPNVLVVPAASPYKTVADVIAAAQEESRQADASRHRATAHRTT